MSKITPIYTIYESMQKPDGTWDLGYLLNAVHFTSKRKAKKAIRARYENMTAQHDADNITLHEKEDGLFAPHIEFDRRGNHYMHFIVQHILV